MLGCGELMTDGGVGGDGNDDEELGVDRCLPPQIESGADGGDVAVADGDSRTVVERSVLAILNLIQVCTLSLNVKA